MYILKRPAEGALYINSALFGGGKATFCGWVAGEGPEGVAGKRGLLGGLLGAVPFRCFSIETAALKSARDLGFLSPVAGGRDSYFRTYYNLAEEELGTARSGGDL